MSRSKVASSFASRTAFDVLAVESDESEEEQVVEEEPAIEQPEPEAASSQGR